MNDVALAKLTVAAFAVGMDSLAVADIFWMLRFRVKSVGRGVGAAILCMLAFAVPVTQIILYRKIAGVQFPTRDDFVFWVLLTELLLVSVTLIARLWWLDRRAHRRSS